MRNVIKSVLRGNYNLIAHIIRPDLWRTFAEKRFTIHYTLFPQFVNVSITWDA